MKKILFILLLLKGCIAFGQIDQKFESFAYNLDSLYNHTGRQLQPIFVHGRFSINDGFAAIFFYDSTSTLTEVPYTIFKVTGKDTGRWIQSQLLSSGGGDTSIFSAPDYIVLDILTVPPVSPTAGDIYLAGVGSAGAWINEDDNIQEWTGSTWQNTVPTVGQLLINAANDGIYKYTVSGWIRLTSVLHDPVDNYGNRNLSAGNARNKAFSLRTNNLARFRIDSVGRTYIYNTPAGTAGTDSVLVQSGGMIRKISATYYGTGSGAGATNSNIGSGYRLAVPNTNNIKTLHAGTNITLDSAANANEITINASGASQTTSYQTITATAGQTAFTFTSVPATASDYWLDRNGMVVNASFYSVSGNIITFTSGLVVGDLVGFHRVK